MPEIGRTASRYRILKTPGGGKGIVYRADAPLQQQSGRKTAAISASQTHLSHFENSRAVFPPQIAEARATLKRLLLQ